MELPYMPTAGRFRQSASVRQALRALKRAWDLRPSKPLTSSAELHEIRKKPFTMAGLPAIGDLMIMQCGCRWDGSWWVPGESGMSVDAWARDGSSG